MRFHHNTVHFRGNKYVWNVLKEQVKDNVAASTITLENEVEMDEKEEKDEISVETNKSLELLIVLH